MNAWARRIEAALNREKKWRKAGQAVVARYRDEKGDKEHKYNVLYANTSVLQPAVFSSVPRPDVRRTFPDANPVALLAAEVVERCLLYYADNPSLARHLRRARDDFLLPGRGLMRVRYDAKIKKHKFPKEEAIVDSVGMELRPAGYFVNGNPIEPDYEEKGVGIIEEKTDEKISCEHVYWEDFVHDDAKSWDEVNWIAFRATFTKNEAKEFFGKNFDKLIVVQEDDPEKSDLDPHYECWEVWDKVERKRLWVSLNTPDVIEEEDDPLGLEGFFPVPRPLLSIETTDSLIPVPLFAQYEPQAVGLDEVASRRARIVRAMKMVGWYQGDRKEDIAAFETADDGDLIPIKVFDKSPREAIAWNPINDGAVAIQQLMLHQSDLESKVFQISGISDIMRSDSNPRESATAQRFKMSSASLRLRPLREQMEDFIRDLYRIAAEIICEKFDPQTIARITGINNQQVIAFLKDQKVRDYSLDIETDSTVQPDLQVQKQELSEFVSVLSPLLQQIVGGVQAFPPAAPALLTILGAVVRQYNIDPKIENVLQTLAQQIVQMSSQPKPPSETQIKEEAETKRVQMREMNKAQMAQMKGRMEAEQNAADRDLQSKELALQAMMENNRVETSGNS